MYTTKGMLLSCGVVASPIFILVFLIEGITRANYTSFYYPISSLSLEESGWIQTVSFIITGFLLLVFSIGLRKVFDSPIGKFPGPLLFSLTALGLIGAGIFATDPVFGYPIDKPLILTQFSVHGHLHDTFTMLAFTSLASACLVFRKRFVAMNKPRWAAYSMVTGIVMIITFTIAWLGFRQYPGLVNFAGVFQRFCIASGGIWITMLSLNLLRTRSDFIIEDAFEYVLISRPFFR